MNELRVIDVSYANVTVKEGIAALLQLWRAGGPAQATYLNLDGLRLAHLNAEYHGLLQQMNLVLPDGIGVRLATRLTGQHKRAHWNVTDFYLRFMAEAAGQGAKFYLLGSPDGVAEAAALKFKGRIPGIHIVGTHPGYVRDAAAAVAAVNASGADILILGMGAPLQERWLMQHRAALKPALCIGVGALFDWVSGRHRRAPVWVQRIHLEWAWRILLEPKRMFKRYLVNDLGFLLSVPFRKPRALPPP
jgi:N-acetylglucosaminyldiphosphoundecaprenol N-acetyl-beta-D-mannosaminyltransferase